MKYVEFVINVTPSPVGVQAQGADCGQFVVLRCSILPFEETDASRWRDGNVLIYCFCLVLGVVGHRLYVCLGGGVTTVGGGKTLQQVAGLNISRC